jgi:hypothetical protein
MKNLGGLGLISSSSNNSPGNTLPTLKRRKRSIASIRLNKGLHNVPP